MWAINALQKYDEIFNPFLNSKRQILNFPHLFIFKVDSTVYNKWGVGDSYAKQCSGKPDKGQLIIFNTG